MLNYVNIQAWWCIYASMNEVTIGSAMICHPFRSCHQLNQWWLIDNGNFQDKFSEIWIEILNFFQELEFMWKYYLQNVTYFALASMC